MKNLLTLLLGLIIGALAMYFYCCKEDNVSITHLVTPRGVITPTEAKTLNNNWTKLRKAANDSVSENKIDNRSSWYSIEDISNYLTLVQENNDKVSGIRLYLGLHGDLDKGGKTTIFMIPTEPNPDYKPGGKDDPNKDDPNGRGLDRSADGIPPGQGYPN